MGGRLALPGTGPPYPVRMAVTDAQARVLTIPNAISVARLAGVPVFLWLVLGLRTQTGDWWAVGCQFLHPAAKRVFGE